MAQIPMYQGMVNSPQTELTTAIDDIQTIIDVQNGDSLPDAPNLAVIIGGELSETILYTEKIGNTLSGITRGFQGEARGWSLGTKIARNGTEYDHRSVKENIEDLQEQIEGITPASIGAETPTGAQEKADAAQTAAEESAQTLVNDLQIGVNQLDSDLTTHTATQVHEGEAHGLRINPTTGELEYFNGTTWVAIKSERQKLDTIIYYVNSSTGDDNNDGLTSGTAWKTIKRATDFVTSNDIIGTVTVDISGTFTEELRLNERSGGGYLRFMGPTEKVKVPSVYIQGGGSRVLISNFELTATSGIAMQILNGAPVTATANKIVSASSNIGIYATMGSVVTLTNNEISNKTRAVYASNAANVLSSSTSGSGNSVGLWADFGGVIVKDSSQASATTAEQTSNGGLIR